MSRRPALWTALAVGHLALVVCGACKLNLLPGDKLPGKVLDCYGAVSGASNSYGFFAPNVGVQTRATFTMIDETGREWTDVLNRGDTAEANFRFNDTTSLFTSAGEDMDDHLSASLAAVMFGRHPQAQVVVVTVEFYNPPTMREYRAGARAQWEPLYRNAFLRNEDGSIEKGMVPS